MKDHPREGALSSGGRASATWRAGRWFQLTPTTANGQPAFGWYFDGLGVGLVVLAVDGGRITHFLDSDLLPRFGLPPRITFPKQDQ